MFFFFYLISTSDPGYQIQCVPNKVSNRILFFILGDKILGQSGQKRLKRPRKPGWPKVVQKYCFPTSPLKFCQQLFWDTFYIYLIMHYIRYISRPIIGFKWDWSVAKCTEHYVASCTSFSFEQELHYSGGWRVPSPFQWSFHCQIFEQLPTKKTLITLISVPFSDLRISVAITLSTILPLPNLCQFHQLLRKRFPAH